MALKVLVDWLRNGTFADAFDDVTRDVAGGAAGSVDVEYGRELATALEPTTAGNGSLVLLNGHRRYSPRNASSPLFGNVKPGRPVRVQRTVNNPAGGVNTYNLFYGHGDDQPINAEPGAEVVRMGLVDNLADFRGQRVTTSLGTGIRTGVALGLILDAIGWTGGRDIDPGVTVMPWWWESNADVLEAFERLLASEGPPALLTMGPNGEVVFRDRHHRITRAASLTSKATFRGIGPEPVMHKDFEADESWSSIINDVTVSVPIRKPTGRIVVWETTDPVWLLAGAYTLTIETTDPFYNLEYDTRNSIQYEQSLGGPSSVTFSRSSGASAIVTLNMTHPGLLTRLSLYGNSVPISRYTTVSASDAASKLDYGPRTLPNPDLAFAGPYDAQRIIDTVVAQRKAPLTKVQARFKVGTGAAGSRALSDFRANAVLSRNLSDRVTVVEQETQINGPFFVERIRHNIADELDHTVTLGLEATPPDVAPVGTAMFAFNTAGQGFNQGRFS